MYKIYIERERVKISRFFEGYFNRVIFCLRIEEKSKKKIKKPTDSEINKLLIYNNIYKAKSKILKKKQNFSIPICIIYVYIYMIVYNYSFFSSILDIVVAHFITKEKKKWKRPTLKTNII